MFTVNAFLPVLGIVAPPSPLPYILLFVVVLIVAIVLLILFPSLRKYRMKRNILVYLLVAVVLVFSIFQAYEVSRGRTVYEYYITDNSFPNFYPGQTNQFNLTCKYLETRPASFYMVINSVNVSFPAQPEETYILVNSTAIKVLFTVSENTPPMHEDTKTIFFNINESVTGFSFRVYPETVSDTLFPAGNTYGMDYVWNGTENCYVLSQPYMLVQP
jgi:hypothetical protein